MYIDMMELDTYTQKTYLSTEKIESQWHEKVGFLLKMADFDLIYCKKIAL